MIARVVCPLNTFAIGRVGLWVCSHMVMDQKVFICVTARTYAGQ
jgi:hypothetical protein